MIKMFREGILFIFLLEHIRSNLRTPDCNEFTQCRFSFNTSFYTFHRFILFLGLHVDSTISILFLGLDVDLQYPYCS